MKPLAALLVDVADAAAVVPVCRNIAESVELSPAERDCVMNEAATVCEQLQALGQSLADPEDEADLYRSLAAMWLELRFAWQRHNLVANYDTIRTGTCAPIVLVRASVASYILQRIESLLSTDHRDRLGDTAVQLLDVVRDEVEQGNLHVGA